MRVVAIENVKAFGQDGLRVRLAAGQEIEGAAAELLHKQAPDKVLLKPAPVDTAWFDELTPTRKSASDVLAWVGQDPRRAAVALEREQARDKPRPAVVRQLIERVGRG